MFPYTTKNEESAVVGGAGDDEPDELFDEASGRWFALPHRVAESRSYVSVASLPAAALALPAAAAQ